MRAFCVLSEYLDVLQSREREHCEELVSEIESFEEGVFLLFEELASSPARQLARG